MMKRRNVKLIILLVCVLMLVACKQTEGNKEVIEDNEETRKLSIVTTIFAPYDYAREITGDRANLSMLLKPGSETHSFEPSPQDIITIQNCDVFIYVGGESDDWVNGVLDSIDNSNMKIVKLMDCVDTVEEEIVEGMEEEEHDHEGEAHTDDHDDEDEEHNHDEHAEWDEHVWTSPKNAILIAKEIGRVLKECDEENADVYQSNLDTYVEKLTKLDEKFTQVVANAKRNTIIFGDRFPLRYFVEEYHLDYFAAFPGCSNDTQASAATIAFLVDKVKAEEIPVIFKIELSNGNIANTIAEETGARVEVFYSCHNVTRNDFNQGITYLDLMERNVQTLKEALN